MASWDTENPSDAPTNPLTRTDVAFYIVAVLAYIGCVLLAAYPPSW